MTSLDTVWASKFNSVASIALTNTRSVTQNPLWKRWDWVNDVPLTVDRKDLENNKNGHLFRFQLFFRAWPSTIWGIIIFEWFLSGLQTITNPKIPRCSALSHDWNAGRLSAKVSANGPISRGGNDRSCKESKVLGRLKMLVTSIGKKPEMQKHVEEYWRDIPLTKKMTVPSGKIVSWKIHGLYSKSILTCISCLGNSSFVTRLQLWHSNRTQISLFHLSVAFHQRLDTVAKGKWGQGFGQQHRHTSQPAGTRKPRKSGDNQVRYWPPLLCKLRLMSEFR